MDTGFTLKSAPESPIFGVTETDTVMLDFDDVTFKTARYWSRRAMSWFKLGGFLILKSSERHYHVVFNRRVDWTENMSIVAWVAELSHNYGLQKWHRMQCIKVGSTLRFSSKGDKSAPRIVCREGEEEDRVRDFLRFRRQIKDILRYTRKMHNIHARVQ